MSLKGKTGQTNGVSPDIQGLRDSMVGYLMGQGQQNGPPQAQIASWGTGQVGGQSLNIAQPQQQTGPMGGQMIGDPMRRVGQPPLQGTPTGEMPNLMGGGMPISQAPASAPQLNPYQQSLVDSGKASAQDFNPMMNQTQGMSQDRLRQFAQAAGGSGAAGIPFNRQAQEDPYKTQARQNATQNEANSSFDRMFVRDTPFPGQVQVSGPDNIGPLGQVQAPGQARDVGFGSPATTDFSGQFNPMSPQQIDPTGFGGDPNQFNRGQVRDVANQGIGGINTQSVDQLGGANSAFFQNMMAQLKPAFDQQRALAAAQGSESAGNLTGSSFANRLGGALNRSLGDEQAQLANYAAQGLGMEVNRQGQMAGLNTSRDIAGMQGNLQGQMANQGADIATMQQLMQNSQFGGDQRLRALMANQGADLQAQMGNQDARLRAAGLGQQGEIANMDAMLRQGQLNQGSDLERMRMGLQAGIQNQNTELARLQANQGMMANRGSQQAALDQQRNMAIYGQQGANAQQNAQSFLNMLLGMGTTGVGAPQATYTPGFLDAIGSIGGQALGGWAAGGFK